MKDKVAFLFKRNEKLGASPIMFVFLGAVVIFALLYFFVFNKEESEVAPPPTSNSSEETSFVDKIKDIFSFGGSEEESEPAPQLPTVPQIPQDVLIVDEELLKEEVVAEETSDFNMDEINIEDVGRRDPMRKIVGDNVGTFDKTRINDEHADLKDESKNYFGGVTIDDVILDQVTYDELGDDKLRGNFIINGSLVRNLEVGDYLLELYYVKDFNSKENYVILQYMDDTYKLKAQNILGNSFYSEEKSTDVPEYK